METKGSSEDIYKNAIKNSRDIIFWVSRNGDVCCCNKSFLSFFIEKKDNECMSVCNGLEDCFCYNLNIKKIDNFFKNNGDWEEFFDTLTEEPVLYETTYTNSTGTTVPVEFYVSKVMSRDKALIVAKDITERKIFEFKIKQVTNELIRSNKDLQEFAYIASHDLKEPLRKISMFSNKLANKFEIAKTDEEIKLKIPDEECYFYLSKISGSSSRMQDMIDSILEYSRVGTSGGDFCCCDMTKIIKTAIENCEASLEEKNVKIIIEDLSYPYTLADCEKINQVFQNLISNSIKFKKENISLIIKIGQKEKIEGDRVVFFVEDNGIGMKEEFCQQIFQPFKKLHSKDKYCGHGMGLSICKKIIERHGGKVSAKSVENEWTRIEFDLQIYNFSDKRV